MPTERKPNVDEHRFRDGGVRVILESFRWDVGLPTAVEPARGVGLMRIRPIAGGVEVLAPAKLNLFLEVLGRRSDGYHEIETVMVAVNLYDTLNFRDDPSGEIRLRCSDPALPVGSGQPGDQGGRSTSRAATGCRRGAHIELTKAIPAQAGLARRLERRRGDTGRPGSALGPEAPRAAVGRPGGGGRQRRVRSSTMSPPRSAAVGASGWRRYR